MPLDLPPPPWIVGHRGAAGDEVENTVESLLLAVEQGADLVEFDVQLASDGVAVLFHDWELERLTGRTGAVEATSSRELAALELAGSATGRRRIPTLGEALAALPVEVPLNLELKHRHAGRERWLAALAGQLAGRRPLLVSSYDWELLRTVRDAFPSLPVAPLERHDASRLVPAAAALGAWSVHCHRRLVTPELAARAAADGFPLLAFTVNEADEARALVAAGASGLFTDHPSRLRAELARSPAP